MNSNKKKIIILSSKSKLNNARNAENFASNKIKEFFIQKNYKVYTNIQFKDLFSKKDIYIIITGGYAYVFRKNIIYLLLRKIIGRGKTEIISRYTGEYMSTYMYWEGYEKFRSIVKYNVIHSAIFLISTKILAAGPISYKYLKYIYPYKKIRIFPTPVLYPERVLKKKDISKKSILKVGFCGGLDVEKGYDIFLEIIKIYNNNLNKNGFYLDSNKKISFQILGEQTHKNTSLLKKEKNLKVSIKRPVPRKELINWMRELDFLLFCNPMSYGFGQVCLEALSLGNYLLVYRSLGDIRFRYPSKIFYSPNHALDIIMNSKNLNQPDYPTEFEKNIYSESLIK